MQMAIFLLIPSSKKAAGQQKSDWYNHVETPAAADLKAGVRERGTRPALCVQSKRFPAPKPEILQGVLQNFHLAARPRRNMSTDSSSWRPHCFERRGTHVRLHFH